jgi:hypothetical protein
MARPSRAFRQHFLGTIEARGDEARVEERRELASRANAEHERLARVPNDAPKLGHSQAMLTAIDGVDAIVERRDRIEERSRVALRKTAEVTLTAAHGEA